MIARPHQNDAEVSELKINVVLVEETSAPEGDIPIQWYLLTTLPIDTDQEVSAVIEPKEQIPSEPAFLSRTIASSKLGR